MLTKLIVNASGGLANKMRAIDSSIALCGKFACAAELLWFTSAKSINARFCDLFEPIDLPGVVVRDIGVCDRCLYGMSRKRNFFIPDLLRRVSFPGRCWDGKDIQRFARLGTLNTVFNARGKTGFAICNCQMIPSENRFSMFRPLPPILSEIETQTSRFANKKCFGAHIRRGDHKAATSHSPLELFTERIKTEFDNGCECCYAATDSDDVKTELRRLFGGRVIVSEHSADRTTLAGIRHAVAEFYTLAAVPKIYGSFTSTFAETAAWIGQSEYIELSSRTQ